MMKSEKEVIVYTSRRNKPNSMRISLCTVVACERRRKKRVALNKGKNGTESNEMVKCRRRRRKRKRRRGECDDVTRLQRRVRYLLIKIKLETNLLEAYSADGWKGRSREKVRPEKELQRAKKAITKCKIGIREIIRELDLLISTCKCASHLSRLESPEKVPCADNKKLCKYDENKMMIIEAINAHLCTSFSVGSSYVDIFKEEATKPDSKDLNFKDEQDWPSDESEDEDYDPDLNEVPCCSGNETEEMEYDELDLSNSTTFNSNNDKIEFGETDEGEIMHCPRQRMDVDYKKLHEEMFGKNAENEESEDEEWGLHVRKKGRKQASEDRCMVVKSTRDTNKILNDDVPTDTSKYSRIPPSAVKELQRAFSMNELPSRSVKDDLSKQLGLSLKKVDVWFKNARCAALKLRKVSPSICEGTDKNSDDVVLLDASCSIPLSELVLVPEKRFDSQNVTGAEHENVRFNLMRRMCTLQNRVYDLQKTLLLAYGASCEDATIKNVSQVQQVMYVPFANLKEKKRT